MDGLCQCGCGGAAPIAYYTNARLGYRRGQAVRFISGHNHLRELNPRWNGGKSKTNGYVLVAAHEHPRASAGGYVMEHILVAEKALGRPLPLGVEVHHVNEVKHDNHRPFNLVICQDHGFHMLLHQRARAYRATGNPNARKCVYCKEWGFDLKINTSSGGAYHAACNNAHVKEYTHREIKERL